jgi:hypothetical protein
VGWDQRFGSFDAELEHVRLLDGAGSEAALFTPDDSLELEITGALLKPVRGLYLHVTLRSGEGTELYGTTTRVHGVTLEPPVGGRIRVRLKLDRLGLAPGSYRFDVAAHDETGADLDCHQGLYPFQVESEVRETGMLRPPGRWEVGDRPPHIAVSATALPG